MKRIIKSLIYSLVLISCLFAQSNKWSLELKQHWKFKIDPERIGISEKWYNLRNYSSFEEIDVPAYWESTIEKEYDGWAWYFNTFKFSKKNNKIAVKCDAIDDDAVIWINGNKVGSHKGWSESFYFDITKDLVEGENYIVILVEDHGGPGGIYKPIRIVEYEFPEEILQTEFSKLQARNSAEWIKKGIIYEIFPRTFSEEGTFNGITNKLEQLKELGVTILWLMPINPIGEKNRKGSLGSPYSTKDFYTINPDYGNINDLKNLIGKAHALGMKVIVDVVLNHSSWDNELIRTRPEFYTRDRRSEIIPPNTDWWDVVDFNYNQPDLQNYMIAMLKYWIKEFDLDGFRCDVSELVPTDFWETARKELDKIKPLFLLSEGSLPEHHLIAFDMTYSWNIYDVLNVILQRKLPPQIIFDILKNEKLTYPKNSLRMRFNENHDKKRAVEFFSYDGAFITTALINTIPGVPLIHNGQEVGDSMFSSLFEKTNINWGTDPKNNEFFKFYKKLNYLRKTNSALAEGDFFPVEIGDEIFGFTRSHQKNNLLVIFNFSLNRKSIDLNFLPNNLSREKFNFDKAIGRKYEFDVERMGRPANKIINLEPLGFIILEYLRN